MVLKMKTKNIKDIINENVLINKNVLNDCEFVNKIYEFYKICLKCILSGGKILACGNGGSAADASHFATELMGRFNQDRNPYPAISLNSNSVLLTALANDYEYCKVFSRQVSALMQPEDVLVAISTSGLSSNILNAIKSAKQIGGKTVVLTSELFKNENNACDLILNVPSKNTPRIQECHTLILHIVCELMEKELYDMQLVNLGAIN